VPFCGRALKSERSLSSEEGNRFFSNVRVGDRHTNPV
jgi:hypothetical protein